MSDKKKKSYLATCSPRKKWAYFLLFSFVIVWCFFSGYVLSNALLPDLSGSIVTSRDIINSYKPPVPDNPPDASVTPGIDDPIVEPDNPVTADDTRVVLLIGCDERDSDIGRSDTIMLAIIHEQTKQLKLLSIPRDTYVQIPGSPTKTKINHAYSFGGATLAASTIESVLGIKIDNYAKINFRGFEALVEAIGGVEIDVPMDMYNADEHISIKKGLQKLNGSDALGFVRYREPIFADVGRVGRQQYFLTELAKQVLVAGNIPKIPSFISIASKNVVTDFTTAELLSLADFAFDIDLSAIESFTLPGDGRYIKNVSYFIVDEGKCKQMVSDLFSVPLEDVKLVFPDSSQSTEFPENYNPAVVPPIDGDEPVLPVDGDEPVLPVDGDEPVLPVDGDEPVLPVDGDEPVLPVDGDEPVLPVDGDEPVLPVDGDEPAPPAEGGEPAPPAEGGDEPIVNPEPGGSDIDVEILPAA